MASTRTLFNDSSGECFVSSCSRWWICARLVETRGWSVPATKCEAGAAGGLVLASAQRFFRTPNGATLGKLRLGAWQHRLLPASSQPGFFFWAVTSVILGEDMVRSICTLSTSTRIHDQTNGKSTQTDLERGFPLRTVGLSSRPKGRNSREDQFRLSPASSRDPELLAQDGETGKCRIPLTRPFLRTWSSADWVGSCH